MVRWERGNRELHVLWKVGEWDMSRLCWPRWSDWPVLFPEAMVMHEFMMPLSAMSPSVVLLRPGFVWWLWPVLPPINDHADICAVGCCLKSLDHVMVMKPYSPKWPLLLLEAKLMSTAHGYLRGTCLGLWSYCRGDPSNFGSCQKQWGRAWSCFHCL